jgi:hypothetical protein
MKPHLGKVRKRENTAGMRDSDPVDWLAKQDGIANASATLLQLIEEAASPNEFSREDAQSQENREPTGARQNDHDDAQSEQGESEENLKEALRLIEALYEHLLISSISARTPRERRPPIAATYAFRCRCDSFCLNI